MELTGVQGPSEEQEQDPSQEQTVVQGPSEAQTEEVLEFRLKWLAFSPPKAEEWETIYRTMAQGIIMHVLAAFLFLIYSGPSLEGKPKSNWDLLPILILLLAATVSLPLAIVALLFPNNMTNLERCQQVRFSFLCLLTGIILALSTCIILMATK